MDRYGPRFGSVGRRRSWILICQVLLTAGILGLAARRGRGRRGHGRRCSRSSSRSRSASQDIVIDAYAVEVLERSEQGIAVGARNALAQIGGARRGGPDDHGSASGSAGLRSSRCSPCCSCRSRASCSGRRSPRRRVLAAALAAARGVRSADRALPALRRAADPRLPGALQVRREPGDGADPTLPDPEVLFARGRGRRDGDDRPDRADRRARSWAASRPTASA